MKDQKEKLVQEISENIGNKIDSEFEEKQNLLGLFAILLAVAKRTNPEKYLVGYRKTND